MSPTRQEIIFKLGDLFGWGSPKQVAGRRAKTIYEVCSSVSTGPEQALGEKNETTMVYKKLLAGFEVHACITQKKRKKPDPTK